MKGEIVDCEEKIYMTNGSRVFPPLNTLKCLMTKMLGKIISPPRYNKSKDELAFTFLEDDNIHSYKVGMPKNCPKLHYGVIRSGDTVCIGFDENDELNEITLIYDYYYISFRFR